MVSRKANAEQAAEMIRLYEVERLTLKEGAAKLDIPISTAHAHLVELA